MPSSFHRRRRSPDPPRTLRHLAGGHRHPSHGLSSAAFLASTSFCFVLIAQRLLKLTVPSWATFLRNHAHETWARDFLPVTDLLFWPLHAFAVVALGSRRVVHGGITRHPTDAWVAQQLREATPFGERPRYLVRDRDSKYGPAFARVAAASGITELRTAYRAPRQNATCERFLGSVRCECLNHVLVLGEGHLRRVLREYVAYFNQDRPHQGLRQHIPGEAAVSPVQAGGVGNVRAFPVLGGLHHAYRRAA